jgi:signal transduction histidine kinase
MTNDDSIARRIEWRLLEQLLSKCWVLIGLNVVLALLFAAVYLSSGRDPNLVLLVLTPRLGAPAIALGVMFWLIRAGEDWRRAHRGKTQKLLVLQEALLLFTHGATSTVWMSEQDYSVNGLTMAGIGAFGAISSVLAPRISSAATIGRVALFTPLILFCVLTLPTYWGMLLAICLFALGLSLVIAYAVYRENFRQATLEEDLIDARLSTERALSREQAARTALEDETALRERFLHAVTHDLRQPLNALNFHLRRLRKKPTPEVATAFVNTAESCLSSAEAIIESVDGAAWMRGDLPPAALSPVALGPLLSAIASEAQPLAEPHGLSLTYVSTGAAVQADGEYLERVIRNLVRNAIQHAKSRILIEVRRSGADISVIVMDDGSGVPTDAQDAIFEPFYQVPGGGRRSAGNVGLGLSIVAELVRSMGGQVALKSAEGRGAAFQVVLPCAEKAASNYVPASMVMVIDDDDDAAGAVIAALELAGCSAHRYGGPLVAEAIAEAVRTATCPVFLDYHLGATVTAGDALALLSEDERTPVTIVTSDTSPEVLARAREFGVTRILKPLGAEKIADILGSA